MRVVGLDIDRVCAEAVMLENRAVRRLYQVGMTREHLTASNPWRALPARIGLWPIMA